MFQMPEERTFSKYYSTRQNRNAEYERPAPTQSTCSGITKEPEIKKDLKDILADAKAFLSTEENKQSFYDKLIELGLSKVPVSCLSQDFLPMNNVYIQK